MQVLNQTQVAQVSGGANDIISQIHRMEWNTYGVLLANAGIYAWNLIAPNSKLPYAQKVEVNQP
jgi:hypothetical protein